MAVVSLITDFGLDDEYTGVMKGAVLRVNPQVTLVDICHRIAPFDIPAAARMLAASYAFFPERTVHVVVVDPGVGSERNIVAIDMDRHLFLVPDNGIGAYLAQGLQVDDLVCVEPERLGLDPLSATFHGRDLFAPVAAHMASGMPLRELGSPYDASLLVTLPDVMEMNQHEGRIDGRITSIDRFGNLITGIDRDSVLAVSGDGGCESLELTLCGQRIKGLARYYEQVAAGKSLMLIGSRGYLEVAVNQGSAKQVFQASVGDPVTVFSGKTGVDIKDEE
jgi:S-adenosyl-L-methionine hydrolase (adenosine-forming)